MDKKQFLLRVIYKKDAFLFNFTYFKLGPSILAHVHPSHLTNQSPRQSWSSIYRTMIVVFGHYLPTWVCSIDKDELNRFPRCTP